MKRRNTPCIDCGEKGKWFHCSQAWKSGYNSRCTDCRAKWRRRRPNYRANCQLYRQLASDRARMFVMRHLKKHPCVDCGETNICCLTFDHVRGKKRADISRMIVNGCSPATLAKEIAKTEIRCGNCHMIRTAKTRGYARALIQFGH